jgi:multidrug efflux system membrane fusion protein
MEERHCQSRGTLVPYRHYLLAPLRAGLSAIAMVVMATVMTACSNSQAEAPPPPPPDVDAAQVVTKSVRQWDEFTGRIAATGAVDIRPRVSGYIDRIAFKEGDMVKAGDLLFVIDPRPLRAFPASARYSCSAAATMRCASGSIRTKSLRAA